MSAHATTNAGAVALAALKMSHAAVAREVGVSRGSAAHWRSGRALPREAAREKLRAAFGIAVDAWDQKLDAAPDEQPHRDAQPTSSTPPYPKRPDNPSPLQHAQWSLACIAHDMEHRALPFSAVTKLRAEEARVLGTVAKLQQAEELAEDRYVREHGAWLDLKRKILAALAPFPDASQAVLEAIKP